MARIKIDMPPTYFFKTLIPVHITDINYGNHLANDKVLSIMHEARVRLLNEIGCSELDIGNGVSIIMGDAAIEFKSEGFYGNDIAVEIAVSDFGSRSFELYYKLTNLSTNAVLAYAKTGIVCFNYQSKKTEIVPESFKKIFL